MTSEVYSCTRDAFFPFCALLLRKNGMLESSCCTAGVAHWALSIYRCWQEPYKGTIWESLTDRLLGTQICHVGYEFTLKADIGGYTFCLPPLSLSPSREPGFRLLCWKPSPPQMGIKRDPTSATWSRIHVFRDPVMLFVSDPGLNVCRSPHHAVASAGLSMALVTFPINLSPPPTPHSLSVPLEPLSPPGNLLLLVSPMQGFLHIITRDSQTESIGFCCICSSPRMT